MEPGLETICSLGLFGLKTILVGQVAGSAIIQKGLEF